MTDGHPSPPDAPLLLVEDLALLLADDRTGTPAGAGTLHYSLGAAVLVELALLGRVETQEKSWLSGSVVHATAEGPLPDPLLQDAYDTIAQKPQPVTSLLMTIGADLWTPILHRLSDRGLVSQEKRRFLGIIPSLDPQPRWSGTVYNRAKEFEQGEWGAQALGTAVLQTAAAVAVAGAAAVTTATNATNS